MALLVMLSHFLTVPCGGSVCQMINIYWFPKYIAVPHDPTHGYTCDVDFLAMIKPVGAHGTDLGPSSLLPKDEAERRAITSFSLIDMANTDGAKVSSLPLSTLNMNVPFSALLIPALVYAAYKVVLLYDASLSRFALLLLCRYCRLAIGLCGHFRYGPPVTSHPVGVVPQDATIVLTTISIADNLDFDECLSTCLLNGPAKVIIVTDTAQRATEAIACCKNIQQRLRDSSSVMVFGAKPPHEVLVEVVASGVADKRVQIVHGIQKTDSRILVLLDDHVFLKPRFLSAVTAVFDNPKVGICGTRKRVRWRQASLPLPRPPRHMVWHFPILFAKQYWLAFWNFLGIVYLTRHNFELRGTSGMDGGVFVISGRAMAVRTALVKTESFFQSFLYENVVWPRLRAGLGRLGVHVSEYATIGDDNCVTNYISRHHLTQYLDTEDATVETNLGEPSTFVRKCIRWRRTTYRYNMSLLYKGCVWSRWPITVWFLAGALVNLSLFWDTAILFEFTKTDLCSQRTLIVLGICIYFLKAVKLASHFRTHPSHFFLFFFPLPAYHCWAYFHSLLSIYSFLTCWDQTWEGGTHIR